MRTVSKKRGLKELGHAHQALAARYEEAQVEAASLRERLAGQEGGVAELQKMRASSEQPTHRLRASVHLCAAARVFHGLAESGPHFWATVASKP